MATRITYRASVTHEYDEIAPQTYHGEIVAANGARAVRRAYEAACNAFPNARPRPFVVVLEEVARSSYRAAPPSVLTDESALAKQTYACGSL